MKIYTTYSPSHENLYQNYFLSSIGSEFEVNAQKLNEDSNFYQKTYSYRLSFSGQTDPAEHAKLKFWKVGCENNMGQIIVCSDVDVQFFGEAVPSLLEELGDFDVACQYGGSEGGVPLNGGFFVMRCNERTLNFLIEIDKNFTEDSQYMINKFKDLCKCKALSDKFFTIGQVLARAWRGEVTFTLPNPILVHHAAGTSSMKQKIELLDLVKKRVSAR